jgi:hypothetical protein
MRWLRFARHDVTARCHGEARSDEAIPKCPMATENWDKGEEIVRRHRL